MPSIIEGYNYDIFISYRQKDNKGDRWVSKFVEVLKTELEATFKEDVSVYFDENPHDRLQETYNVNKSLEGKLKCLIFIPILSQTYCDPNSYAWQFEFLAFNKLANEDRFGRDVKLRSGNVASRILPVRIHDLEPEDIKLFEKETGSVLRSLDFVFKTSAGVNRPLKVNEDHPQDNLNKTYYSDQINKIAIAIKDILQGLKAEITEPFKEKPKITDLNEEVKKEEKIQIPENAFIKLIKGKFLTGVVLSAIVLIIVAVYAIPKLLHLGNNKVMRDPDGRISVAVNNFDNNTNDTTLNWLKMGIPELLRNNLAETKELLVQNTQTMNELYESLGQTENASVVPSLSREAAIKLKAGTYITGSFQKYGYKILILVKLIDTKNGELLWTGQTEGNLERIKTLTDSLSLSLKNFLEIKALKQNANPEYADALTNSSEAYLKYIEGMRSLYRMDFKSALSSFLDAYKIDSTFVLAAFYVANVYQDMTVLEGKEYSRQVALWIQKAYNNKEKLPEDYRLWLEIWYAGFITKSPDDFLKYCDLLRKSDIKSRYFLMDLADSYRILDKQDKALDMFEKIEKISSDWNEEWKYQHYYSAFGVCCFSLGMHDKEAKIYQEGLKLFPEDFELKWLQAKCATATGDTARATQLIGKLAKEKEWPESTILNVTGYIYEQANLPDKAEKFFRHALQLDSKNYKINYALATFLINSGRNVDEGMELLNSLQKKHPGVFNYDFFYNKSLGLFKQGKYAATDSLLNILRDSCITIDINLDKLRNKVKDSLSRQN
jgi:TolB-like protein